MLESEFPDLFTVSSLGYTYLNDTIPLIRLSALSIESQHKDIPTSILVTGAHHARELTSVTMNIYLMFRLLHDYVNKEPATI